VRSRTGEVLGGLFFGHEASAVFTEREERLVVGVAGWAAVAMDNARLYAGERLAREGAEAAARTKTEFLATMSHEFRTPLNAVLGYAQLLELGVLGPNTAAQQSHLERLQASARHLLGLIDDVLDVAKVDADRLVVRQDRLLTGAVVAAAVAVVQPQATMRGVRLMDLGSGDPGVAYLGDEHRVRQVLVNLLANAVKFTPSGGEVTVICGDATEPEPGMWTGGWDAASSHAGGAERAPGWAFIRISDTGPGIAPELLGRLFEPFVQGDAALTREHGGTGLGLAISRRLARLMHGDVVARSQPGAGATFTLWLPAAMDVGARGDASVEPQSATGTLAPLQPLSAGRARRTPPRGAPWFADNGAGAMDDAAYDVLHALAVRLAAEAETVAERYVAALRADGRFPGARDLPSAQLRDHSTPLIGFIASQLMIIGETRGQAPELLGDGAQVQRVMAELHGTQRHRLGWSEADIERETPILIAETERTLRSAVSTAVIGGASGDVADGSGTTKQPVGASTRYALAASRQMLEQGLATALRSFRFAKATATP
jgi:signal transduction histidine kinase